MAIIAMRQGLCGPVNVTCTRSIRKLTIGITPQGAACHVPSSTEVYPNAEPGPGPVLNITYYQLAWLLAATRHPTGCGLMIGLGAGSGAVAILHHFPGVSLDVIEHDPAVIALARAHFPLVGYFEQDGRLSIIEADAFAYLSRVRRPHAFVLVDIYTNQDKTPATMESVSFVELMLAAAEDVWINTINSLDRPFLHKFLRTLDELGRPVRLLLSPVPRTDWLPMRRNWILSTAPLSSDVLNSFTPYPGLEGEGVASARRAYRTLVTNRLTRAEARQHAESRGIATKHPLQR